jgi:hypothetical protein
MSREAHQFTAHQIQQCFNEVASQLGDIGSQHTIVLVGGSVLALRGIRESTEDVDTISEIDNELRRAIDAVAQQLKLNDRWLNNSARPFAPENINLAHCETMFENKRLRVLSASLKQLLLMKINSARTNDILDILLLWPHTGFANSDEVMSEYQLAYPHANEDEFLGEWLQQLIARAQHE